MLKGLSARARAGGVISMIGSSGSATSTFPRCLNLLERPNDGRIVIGGDELKLVRDGAGRLRAENAKQLQLLRSRIAMVLQHFNLWAHMTALANVIGAPCMCSA